MRTITVLALLATALPACGIPLTADAFHATAEAQYLDSVVDHLAKRDYDWFEGQVYSRTATRDLRGGLEQLASRLPAEPPVFAGPVGWQVTTETSQPRIVTIAAEYADPSDKRVLVSARIAGEPGALRIGWLNVEPLPARLSTIHALTLRGKGFRHYAVVACSTAVFLLTLVALSRCLLTKGLRHRVLWAVFIAVGFGLLSIQWTSGELSLTPLHIGLLSVDFGRTGWVGPWRLGFSIPVGAIWFLLKERSGARKLDASRAQPEPPPRLSDSNRESAVS